MNFAYLIPFVVRFLLSTGVVGKTEDQLKAQAKEWVYKNIPGTWFDAVAWGVVEGAWSVILGEVGKLPQLAFDSPAEAVWQAVGAASAGVAEALGTRATA